MNLARRPRWAARPQFNHTATTGFTLVEVAIGIAVLGIVVITLYAMLANGFNMVQRNRDNLRATQILINRMEGLRLYNWDQLVHSNMVPTTFVETYAPAGGTNSVGTIYYGTMIITNAPVAATYSNQMKLVTVNLGWTNGGVGHSRTISTFVSQFGVQNYIYAN